VTKLTRRLRFPVLIGAVVLLLLLFWQTQRQDVARSNDHVLEVIPSPGGRFSAFLVSRESYDVSAGVLKVFVSPRDASWDQGKMLMVGRPFSHFDRLLWLSEERLCLVASSNSVMEEANEVLIGSTTIAFQIHPDAASCERANWS
jgi:hypothetical protein